MAYNGYTGFGEDVMDGVETSGPKVTVRDVSQGHLIAGYTFLTWTG